jgi:hypothetical protein
MNRRRFLAALPLGFATGCLGASPFAPNPHPKRVFVAQVDPLPQEFEFRIDAEVRTETVTDDHPATLVLTATNEGDARPVSVATGECSPFNRSRGRSDGGGLWLYRAGTEPDERHRNRWTRGGDGVRTHPAYGCAMREWAAGETWTYEYEVWDDERTDGYYEPGWYRWRLPVRVGTGEDEAEAAWFLELRVVDAE